MVPAVNPTPGGVIVQKKEMLVRKPKRPYEKPRIESEKMFETTALACGKCTTGPSSQFQCAGVPMAS
jgi:hypothetical protein